MQQHTIIPVFSYPLGRQKNDFIYLQGTTRRRADWLQARGCDLLQRLLHSRPAPAEELGLEPMPNTGLAGGPWSGTIGRK
jgi:hypothetical protein